MLSVEQVSCIKQERILFEDLSLHVAAGEIMQLAGPNGAGKTSLLRMVAGFSRAESGAIRFQERTIHTASDWQYDLLFLGHKAAVNGSLTARENMAFWCQSQGIDVGAHTDYDDYALLAELGLVGLEDVPVRTLSAGQQRRVALTRLWLSNAKLWLLDEPFTAIDKKGVALLQARFNAHLANGGAILLTTHQDLTAHFSALKTHTLEYRWL